MTTIHKSFGPIVFALLAAASARADDAPQNAIGRLHTRDSVTIESTGGAFTVADSTHPYFSGDAVTTEPEQTALLDLDRGRLVLGPDSRLAVHDAQDGYRIELQRGWVRAAFRPALRVEVAAGELRVRPAAGDGSPEEATDFIVVREGDEWVLVRSQVGSLHATNSAGGPPATVASGTSEIFEAGSGNALPPVSAEGGLSGPSLFALRVAGIAAFAGSIYALDEFVDESGGGDDDAMADPGSPVE